MTTWLIFGALGAVGYWLYKSSQSQTVPSSSTLQPPSTGLPQNLTGGWSSNTPGSASGTTVLNAPTTPSATDDNLDYIPNAADF
jgi:hypothetical protein